MIKKILIRILFKLLGLDQSLKKVYEASEVPTMDTPEEDKKHLKFLFNKHTVALADVADVEDYVKYLKQLILMYQRLRLFSRKRKEYDYLIIITFLSKHIYELDQSLIKYRKMNSKFIVDVRKKRFKNRKDK